MRAVRAVMSIQSSVVYGHVGSTAATLPLQRLGFDVWALPTVVYSSHAGYPGVRGRRTPVSTLRELLAGLAGARAARPLRGGAQRLPRPPRGLALRARGARGGARAAPRRLVRVRSRARRRGRAVRPGRTRAHVPRAGGAARRPARPEPLRAGVAGRPARARASPRPSRRRASCTQPVRARWSSRGSCSSTTAGRRSTSSAWTTTARGLRARRTSRSSGVAPAMSSPAC